MVYAPERPTEINIEPLDRPLGRFIISDTDLFLAKFGELLPKLSGVIAQNQTEDTSHTVLLDARDYKRHYNWQLTSAYGVNGSRGRKISSLNVARDGSVIAWQAEYDGSGRLIAMSDLDIWADVWRQIETTRGSTETSKNIAELFATRQRQERTLAQLSILGEVVNKYPVWEKDVVESTNEVEIDEKGKLFVMSRKKLNDKELASEVLKQQKGIDRVGFTELEPIDRPKLPTIPQLPIHNLFYRF